MHGQMAERVTYGLQDMLIASFLKANHFTRRKSAISNDIKTFS